ncbi:MAG TPA: YdcF family protein [Puia sp.]|jgi:hypothetical protein|nr:YdcF family protein [Puia sp.]
MSIVTGARRVEAICTLLFSVILSSCFFTERTAVSLLKASSSKTYDMVIVPGVPLENGKWGRMMKARVCWSKYLYDHQIARNIMYSGSSVYTPYYEGKVMALYAVALGIPKEHVFYETRAEHSTENIYYSYKKAKQLGYGTIALASDRFQTKAYERFTQEKVSMGIAILPMVVDTVRMMEPSVRDPVIDCRDAFNKDFVPLKKRESYRERVRGTKGKHIDETLYE